ncbi:MAG: hypothetical protein AAF961_17770, partial [Planctomycetota bacterium]
MDITDFAYCCGLVDSDRFRAVERSQSNRQRFSIESANAFSATLDCVIATLLRLEGAATMHARLEVTAAEDTPRRVRFGIRSLLLGVTALSLLFAYLAYYRSAQRTAILTFACVDAVALDSLV